MTTEKSKLAAAEKRAEKKLADARKLVAAADAIPGDAKPGVDPIGLFKPPETVKGRETQLLDVISGIMSTDNMNIKTVFEDKHIVQITRGHIFAERYNSDTMRMLIQVVSEVRVSKGGLGRKNLVKAITSILNRSEDDSPGDEGVNRRSRLFGGGRVN